MINTAVYNLYKPARNHLRQIWIENAFYVIWAYINFLQFDQAIPSDIQVPDSVVKNKKFPRDLLEWELALLAREMISNGQIDVSFAKANFNKWGTFAAAINKIKEFENNAYPVFGNITNIEKEIRRVAHRQFPWQVKTNTSTFVRYFKIFNNPKVAGIVQKKIGLTVQQWYTLGTAILGAVLTHPKFNIDSQITISTITNREFDIFLQYTSCDLQKIKSIIERDVHFDDEFVYSFNPLEYYPFVRIGSYFYCPIPTFAAWRTTSGLFFDLVDDKNFGHPFGLAFQDYLEEISRAVIKDKNIEIITEQKYKVDNLQKDSVDLIISQGSKSTFFVEAKTKRLSVRSKSQLISENIFDKDLDILAEDVVQIYATIHDYLNGHYQHYKFKPNIKIYPLLVTLEDWYLIGDSVTKLASKVKLAMIKKTLPENYLQMMPYTICSAQNFEHFIQILNNEPFETIMNKWFMPDKIGHNFGQFIMSNFTGDYKNIDNFFSGDFEKIYPKGLIPEPGNI